MSAFRRILSMWSSSGSDVRSSDDSAQPEVEPKASEAEGSDPGGAGSNPDPAVDPCKQSSEQNRPASSLSEELHSTESLTDQDQAIGDAPTSDLQSSDSECADAVHRFHSEVSVSDQFDPVFDDCPDNDSGHSADDLDLENVNSDAHPVDVEAQPDPGFDDICQLPPAQLEAEFWDQTVDDEVDDSVDQDTDRS